MSLCLDSTSRCGVSLLLIGQSWQALLNIRNQLLIVAAKWNPIVSIFQTCSHAFSDIFSVCLEIVTASIIYKIKAIMLGSQSAVGIYYSRNVSCRGWCSLIIINLVLFQYIWLYLFSRHSFCDYRLTHLKSSDTISSCEQCCSSSCYLPGSFLYTLEPVIRQDHFLHTTGAGLFLCWAGGQLKPCA